MRLIDADAIPWTDLNGDNPNSDLKVLITFADKVNRMPTIEQPHWIPCKDRLPGVGQDVLISVGGMYAAEGCLRDDGDWAQFRWNSIQRKDIVGAWLPLPEPYKEVKHE